MKRFSSALLVLLGIVIAWVLRPTLHDVVGSHRGRSERPGNVLVTDRSGGLAVRGDRPRGGNEVGRATASEEILAAFAGAYAEKVPRRRLQSFTNLLDNLKPESAALLRVKLQEWPVSDETDLMCQKLFFAR